MVRPVGIETEYGLNCQGFDGPIDFAFEASALVRSAPLELAFRGWDYTREDPRLDLMGKRAVELARDPNDLRDYTALSSQLSAQDLLANTVLPNGARFYNDHNHPEYCTDVCVSVRELVAQDKAGERLLLACQRVRNAATGRGQVLVVKNNTDYHGRSYGTHENYLVSRATDLDLLVAAMVPFFVARQAIVGAGKVGCEGPFPADVEFQLSQRADFFEEVVGINTTARRPIFNTRDEPHADRRKYRRLHVIAGDANRSEFATALKAGMTGMVLDAVEGGVRFGIRLKDPVSAIRAISRDPDIRTAVDLEDGGSLTALDILETYLEAIERRGPFEGEPLWVVRQWRELLDLLRRDPDATADRLDWPAKRVLYRHVRDSLTGFGPQELQRLDLAYHLVDPSLSLFEALVDGGRMRRLVTEGEVEAASAQAPSGTRAGVRGAIVRRFAESIKKLEWDSVTLATDGREYTLDLGEIEGVEIRRLEQIVSNAVTIHAALDAMRGEKNASS